MAVPAGVVVRTIVENVQATPTSGVVVASPVHGQVLVTMNVSASLKFISFSGDITYHFCARIRSESTQMTHVGRLLRPV